MPIQTYKVEGGEKFEVIQGSKEKNYRTTDEIDVERILGGGPLPPGKKVRKCPSAPGNFGKLSTPGRKP